MKTRTGETIDEVIKLLTTLKNNYHGGFSSSMSFIEDVDIDQFRQDVTGDGFKVELSDIMATFNLTSGVNCVVHDDRHDPIKKILFWTNPYCYTITYNKNSNYMGISHSYRMILPGETSFREDCLIDGSISIVTLSRMVSAFINKNVGIIKFSATVQERLAAEEQKGVDQNIK